MGGREKRREEDGGVGEMEGGCGGGLREEGPAGVDLWGSASGLTRTIELLTSSASMQGNSTRDGGDGGRQPMCVEGSAWV
jgi:hypothetical protein